MRALCGRGTIKTRILENVFFSPKQSRNDVVEISGKPLFLKTNLTGLAGEDFWECTQHKTKLHYPSQHLATSTKFSC